MVTNPKLGCFSCARRRQAARVPPVTAPGGSRLPRSREFFTLCRIGSVLKTALKPKWIGTLVGCLLAATAFVWLSQWQFGQSTEAAPPPASATEKVVPLTSHFEPGRDMYATDADQMVSATGEFVPGTAVLVSGRLLNDQSGYWVVGAFAVQGAPDANIIPVVRGWQANATAPAALPAGEIKLEGRLLPSESPKAGRADPAAGYPDLSTARLSNVWDRDSYDGFIVAFKATTAGGQDVGAQAAGLEPVWVGPQPQDTTINWLNIFYGVEWVVFAGFAFFIWFRLVKDDHQRDSEYQAELEAWQERQDARNALKPVPNAALATASAESGPADAETNTPGRDTTA